MIEIDLLTGDAAARPPGTRRRIDLGSLLAGARDRVRDPWLVIATLSVVLSVGLGVGSWITQRAAGATLRAQETLAVQDSVRFAAVLARLGAAETQRDSVMAQMTSIAAIDRQRFIWPHLLDEIARALPAEAWLRSIAQGSASTAPSVDQLAADSVPPLTIRLVGVTVDIQALTVFMKQLEASPFIAEVGLASSSVMQVEGQTVNEFALDLRYERPASARLLMVPLVGPGADR